MIIGNWELGIARMFYTQYECIYKNLGTCMYVDIKQWLGLLVIKSEKAESC